MTIIGGTPVDTKADIQEAIDRGENTSAMEPLLLSEGSSHRAALNDLAVDLAAASAGFRRSLPEGVVRALADLVRAMNCYYSNLIEGHYTHRSRPVACRITAPTGTQALSAYLARSRPGRRPT